LLERVFKVNLKILFKFQFLDLLNVVTNEKLLLMNIHKKKSQ